MCIIRVRFLNIWRRGENHLFSRTREPLRLTRSQNDLFSHTHVRTRRTEEARRMTDFFLSQLDEIRKCDKFITVLLKTHFFRADVGFQPFVPCTLRILFAREGLL